MPRTFIALDLETTGLDNARDAIIEFGAAKFQDDRIVDRTSTLVNPGRPIPYEITQLTGITDRDVAGKPRFDQIASQIMRFVGSAPVVGHNVSFDLGAWLATCLPGDQYACPFCGVGRMRPGREFAPLRGLALWLLILLGLPVAGRAAV